MNLLSPGTKVLMRAAPRGVDSVAQPHYQKAACLHFLYSAVPSVLPKMSLWYQESCLNSKHHILTHQWPRPFSPCTSLTKNEENFHRIPLADLPSQFINQYWVTCPILLESQMREWKYHNGLWQIRIWLTWRRGGRWKTILGTARIQKRGNASWVSRPALTAAPGQWNQARGYWCTWEMGEMRKQGHPGNSESKSIP